MPLTTHGVAKDHRRAVGIQCALWIAEIFQCLARAGDGPLLRYIHRVGDARRDRQVPLDGIPCVLAHPTADLGVGLVRSLRVLIVIESRIPAIRSNFRDAVATTLYVVPETRDIRRVGQNRSNTDDRYRAMGIVFHDDIPL